MEDAARDHTARARFGHAGRVGAHSRCWMAWPCRTELWGERMPAARKACAEIAKAIVAYEPVTMIARPDLAADASLHCGQGISVLPLEHDDSWIRDVAPTFVIDQAGALAGVDWRFNGYGERTPAYDRDARLAEVICARLKVPRFTAPIVLEGGAVHVDGEGTAWCARLRCSIPSAIPASAATGWRRCSPTISASPR